VTVKGSNTYSAAEQVVHLGGYRRGCSSVLVDAVRTGADAVSTSVVSETVGSVARYLQ